MSDYAGFQLLERFEKHWNDLSKGGMENAAAVKEMLVILTNVQKKYVRMDKAFNRLNEYMQTLPSLLQSIDNVTISLGQLESQFEETEDVLNLLESICEEEVEVEKILKKNEEVHELKITRQKELEELKATLAKEHSGLLEQLERTRKERKKSAEEALQKALWSIEIPDSEKHDHEETQSTQNTESEEHDETWIAEVTDSGEHDKTWGTEIPDSEEYEHDGTRNTKISDSEEHDETWGTEVPDSEEQDRVELGSTEIPNSETSDHDET